MKEYIFIANTLASVSGAPIYVRNKTRYLQSRGWKVVAIDSTNVFTNSIIIDELKVYSNNRFYELLFPPSWYSSIPRRKIIEKIIKTVKTDDCSCYVVESLGLVLGEWGELLSSELKCKHIIFDINENDIIKDPLLYEFAISKYKRNEFFCISTKAIQNIFSLYTIPENIESHWLKSGVYNDVEDVPLPNNKFLPDADFKIGYFGRPKRFIPYVFNEIISFCERHNDLRFSFVVLGFNKESHTVNKLPDNLTIEYLGRVTPIPKAFYHYVDVVIATAGCATISFEHAKNVISMSAEEDERVIGILGKTTKASSYPEDSDAVIKPLSEYLEMCLSGKAELIPYNGFVGYPLNGSISYDEHLTVITPVYEPLDVLKIRNVRNFSQFWKRIFVKLGFSEIIYLLMKKKYRATLLE